MDEFTLIDWVIAGIVFFAGLLGAVIKVFVYDDRDLKDYKDKLKG